MTLRQVVMIGQLLVDSLLVRYAPQALTTLVPLAGTIAVPEEFLTNHLVLVACEMTGQAVGETLMDVAQDEHPIKQDVLMDGVTMERAVGVMLMFMERGVVVLLNGVVVIVLLVITMMGVHVEKLILVSK